MIDDGQVSLKMGWCISGSVRVRRVSRSGVDGWDAGNSHFVERRDVAAALFTKVNLVYYLLKSDINLRD